MTKERYVELRNKGNSFLLSLFYEYYLYKGGFIKDFNDFVNYFNQYLFIFNIDVKDIINNIEKKFNITVVYDKNGKFIKVI